MAKKDKSRPRRTRRKYLSVLGVLGTLVAIDQGLSMAGVSGSLGKYSSTLNSVTNAIADAIPVDNPLAKAAIALAGAGMASSALNDYPAVPKIPITRRIGIKA